MLGRPRSRLHAVCMCLLLVAWPAAETASAQASQLGAPEAGTTGAADRADAAPQNDAAQVLSERLSAQAEAITALAADDLGPEVDPQTLWELDFGHPALAASPEASNVLVQLEQTLTRAREQAPARPGRGVAAGRPQARPQAVDGEQVGEQLAEDADALTRALRRLGEAAGAFFSLPEDKREALLQAHETKRREHLDRAEEATRKQQRAALLQRQATQLEAFLRGELALDVDPDGLLATNLRTLVAKDRLERVLAPGASPDVSAQAPPPPVDGTDGVDGPPSVAAAPAEPADDDARIAALEDALDRLRGRYLALPPTERLALFTTHQTRKVAAERAALEASQKPPRAEQAAGQAKQEAEAAARARREALQAARDARSEALRLVEQERARLLGVREAQAHYKEALSKERIAARESYEHALVWKSKVDALLGRSVLEGPKEPDADRLYSALRAELRRTRGDLHRALNAVTGGRSDAPDPGEPLALPPLDELDASSLQALWRVVQREHEKLQRLEDEVVWQQAELLRDAVVMLNLERLRLLLAASPELRSRITGFGAEGVQQVRHELEQTLLQFRYHTLTLPRHLQQLIDQLWSSPLLVFWMLLKLIFVLGLFRLWHRRAPILLGSLHRWAREQARQGAPTRWLVSLTWYLRRIYRPLDWLLLVHLLLGGEQTLPELSFVHLVASWFLIGSTIVLFLDAVAARRGRRGRAKDESAALRLKTLRLLGLIVVSAGLILSISSLSVGRGAIHAWVTSACWFLALPVGAVIAHWWRPTIFERLAKRRSHNAITRSALARRKHRDSLLAAAVAGFYLLVEGLLEWVVERSQGFQFVRRVMAYVFRARVARKSRLASSLPPGPPLDDAQCASFLPDAAPDPLLPGVGQKALLALLAKAKSPHNTFSALVGERGSGKSVLLARLMRALGEELGEGSCIRVRCTPQGFDDLLGTLANALQTPTDSASVGAAIEQRGIRVVCIDDAHRLVQPRVGGTADLERFEDLARNSGPVVSFVLSFGATAWAFIERAQGDRLTFSHVARLPLWSEAEIAELLRSRTASAGLDPDFDEVALPRQVDEFGEDDSQTESAYFRMLWDSSGGNPTTALQLWRRSLYRRKDGSVVVRLFDEPSTEELERSPLNSLCILRTLVQMDFADVRELALCANLDENVVFDTLRHATAEGYVEHVEDRVRLSLEWYRPIMRVLRRQRLLPS